MSSSLTPPEPPHNHRHHPAAHGPTGVPTLRAHRGGDRNRGGSGRAFQVRGFYHV